jgi:hypothetical protein
MCPECGVVPPAADVLLVPRATDARGRTDAVSAAMRAQRRLLVPIEARAYRAGAAPSRSAA